MTKLAIEAHDLRLSYGSLTSILDGVDLAVPRGVVYGLLGPNGAGKTTLVNLLSTVLRPDCGWARVLHHDVVTEAHAVRQVISTTGQFTTVDDLLTARENLLLMGRLRGLDRRGASARADELLATFGLSEAQQRRVGTYSGGMRRRLDIAAGLVRRPEVVFLDEPTTGLDPHSGQQMWDVVRELVAAGVTVLLTTQYLEEAEQLAQRVAVIDHGRIVAEGTVDGLKQRVAAQRLELTFADEDDLDAAMATLSRAAPRGVHHDSGSRRIGVPTDATGAEVAEVLALLARRGVAVQHVGVRTSSLDDVFFALTGHLTDDGTAGGPPSTDLAGTPASAEGALR